MNEMQRDPELDWMRSQWEPPRMTAPADAAVWAAYRRHFAALRSVRRFWLPLAAAAVAASVALVLAGVHPAEAAYRPVGQPRIIVLSQGERP
jgi:hypothetical protein